MERVLKHPFEEFRSGRVRAGWLAFAITVLLHLFLFLVLPEQLMPVHRPAEEKEAAVTYDIDLSTPAELRYAEVNPDVPVNEPDETNQYSFRAQQAADDSPLSDEENQPKLEGETESLKVVPGQPEPASPVPPGLYAAQAQPGEGEGTEGGKQGAAAEALPAPDQPRPAPDFIQQKPVAEDGPGSSPEQPGEAPKVLEDPDPEAPITIYRQSELAQQPVQSGDGAGGSPEARPMPRERPRLAPELITGPLLNSRSSARRRGDLALDATFSEFGEYEQQFYAAIQTGWYQEIEFFQPIDTATRVHVRFRLKSDGTVDNVEAVQTTASKVATVICETAIAKRSPFRPWTAEMVEVFGQERWINVVFNYR